MEGGSLNKTNDAVWLAFEVLAKTYPHDNGARMTADLSRRLLKKQQRLGLTTPPIVRKVVNAVT
jgi:hypothetical protein